jgi:phage tail-like protein
MADPYRNYNFKLSISDMPDEAFHFTKCTAIGVTVENQEYREAGANQITYQIPTRVKYDPVTLSYGYTNGGRKVWEWLMKAAAGKVERKNVDIILLDSNGERELDKWTLVDAWPQKWQGAELDAASNQVAIATLTLVFNELKFNERGVESF